MATQTLNAGSVAPEQFGAQIAGLTNEVRELRSRVEVLLALVDPEDLRAAMELARITPTHEELLRIAENSVPPPELIGIQEEKPW